MMASVVMFTGCASQEIQDRKAHCHTGTDSCTYARAHQCMVIA